MQRSMGVKITIVACVLLAGCSSEPKTVSVPSEASAEPATPAKSSETSQGVRVPVEERSKPQGFVSEAGTAARSLRRLSPETAPLAPLGQKRGASMLDGVDAPNRVKDPEADAYERGRRIVGPIDEELGGGYSSAEDLARAILSATKASDPKALHALRVSNREFTNIFWPEFPQSRPATNLQADDAWFFHDGTCHDGVNESISGFGGRDLELVQVRATIGRLDFTNFDLYDGIVIDAVDAGGERVSIPWAVTFAERNGRWKVFMFKA